MSDLEPSEDCTPVSSQDLEQNKDEDSHGHFRFHLIEDLSYEDVKKCYRGSCVSCSWLLQALDVRGGVYMYGANVLSLVHSSLGAAAAGASPSAGGGGAKELLMTLPCPSAQTVSKYNRQYHKLFPSVPEEEILMKVYSCALLRDILVQGRLYISRHHLCFYANLFGRDIKVALPVVSVRLVKKHKTAGLVPNGLAITTDTGQKYVFVSLLSRDSVYDVLRRICTHLQVNGKSLSLKQLMEEPVLSLEEFPVRVEFPSELKWRKPSAVSVSSSLPDLLGSSKASTTTSAAPRVSTSSRPSPTPEDNSAPKLLPRSGLLLLSSDLEAELGHREFTLLKLFTLLIIVLIVSSSYLAFRICSLEHQLSFLSQPGHTAPPTDSRLCGH